VSSRVSGYHGRYLRIDLTTGSSAPVELEEGLLRRFLGGSGLGVCLLLGEGAAEADPLSEGATIAFVFSPLVGSPLTTSAKFAVVSKSPLTERINDSLASSGFALAGKKTGHDAIVLTGKASRRSIQNRRSASCPAYTSFSRATRRLARRCADSLARSSLAVS